MSSVFASEEFTDVEVLKQLESLEHQMLVEDHGLHENLVCTVSLAKALRDITTRQEASQYLSSARGLGGDGEKTLNGLLTIAESFLKRSTSKQRDMSASESGCYLGKQVGPYTICRFLARGSGGLIYTAAKVQDEEQFVVKILFESGQHEFEISQALQGAKRCIEYLGSYQLESSTVFVLPLVRANSRGFSDLRQYICCSDNNDKLFWQQTTKQLLEGLEEISSRGIILRDVKPDNVLVDNEGNIFWADFGLAVNTNKLHSAREDLVAYWYDLCKLIPRPKWKARRPPERAYQFSAPTHSFDMYMLGIIFVSMACGIDFPHIDLKEMKQRVEALLDKALPEDYLESFELFASLQEFSEKYSEQFQIRFGDTFGSELFIVTREMLQRDPHARPSPAECLKRLNKV